MNKKFSNKEILLSETISFDDNLVLPIIFGHQDSNLKIIEKELNVIINIRGNFLKISGEKRNIEIAIFTLKKLYKQAQKENFFDPGEVISILKMTKNEDSSNPKNSYEIVDSLYFSAGKKLIKPRTKKQVDYFNLVKSKQLVFCCGPAGTGKTYLSVAYAVSLLKSGQIDKIVLSRPAVEAGERLGFLPGDLKEKIDPYLRPLYDALNDMLSFSEVLKKIDSGYIEIAPLAFMRGRTLSNALIILDESQNTTAVQMKMFLTRLGENSKMIVNGDLSQVDLPSGIKSGLRESISILKGVEDIGFIEFTDQDVVRNPLVSKIVTKYEEYEKAQGVGKEYITKKNS